MATTVTLTIQDAKAALLTSAKDSYNTRTGESLTAIQYAVRLVRSGVVNELEQEQQVTNETNEATAQAALNAAMVASGVALQTIRTTVGEDGDW